MNKMFGVVLVILLGLIFLGNISTKDINWDKLVRAIYKAEGSEKATYLYGIRSVKYRNKPQARQICMNTVKNNWKRYNQFGYKNYNTYLEFLASRYAPLNAENDSLRLNKNWLKNVKYYYNKLENN